MDLGRQVQDLERCPSVGGGMGGLPEEEGGVRGKGRRGRRKKTALVIRVGV